MLATQTDTQPRNWVPFRPAASKGVHVSPKGVHVSRELPGKSQRHCKEK